jgi:hypothetical protein
MTQKSEKVRSIFQEKISVYTKSIPVRVMLADSTVIEQNTFDPKNVERFYQDILKNIPDWKTDGISISKDKDLRRIFLKFETKEGNYLLSCHMSLQYHALLYYKIDHRVIEIQKELANILEKTNTLLSEIAPMGDLVIQEKLKEIGYENVDEQKLFEIFFQNELLTKEIAQKVYSSSDTNLEQLTKKQSDLFKELDNMLLEVYQTTPVMIDETRMIAAEEGCLCNFNLEYVKNQTKEGNFDPIRIPTKVKESLLNRMDQVIDAIKN